eukprot:5486251-Pleurochrysis_carterae.AAC.10
MARSVCGDATLSAHVRSVGTTFAEKSYGMIRKEMHLRTHSIAIECPRAQRRRANSLLKCALVGNRGIAIARKPPHHDWFQPACKPGTGEQT